MKKRILICAGEPSGDLHAAGLISELLKINPELSFFGLGGSKMQAQGVQILYTVDRLSYMGFWEVVRHLHFLKQVKDRLLQEVDSQTCHLAILVDYPGFNLKLAKLLHQRSIPVVYYISPQIWAWGKGRIKQIKEYVRKMIVFFPFEEALYHLHSVPVGFVGHPLLELAKPQLTREEFAKQIKLQPGQKLIGFFPGSRLQEIRKHLPLMVRTGEHLKERIPNVAFIIARAPGIDDTDLSKLIPSDFPIRAIANSNYEIMSYSDFLLVKSGTSTLEAALCQTPFIVLYVTSFLSYLVARRLVQIPYIAMVNVLAGRKVVPEFVQNKARPEDMAATILEFLNDQSRYAALKEELSKVKSGLGSPGAYGRAASEISELL